jgi:tRNA(adenine34) deaminase
LLAVTFVRPASDVEQAAMALALAEAAAAAAAGDVPVGAVVLLGDEVIARARNERVGRSDPTAHAEVLALRAAAAAIGSWRLDAATLVVTLEPCPMCAGALVGARVRRLVFGAANTDNGACGTLYNLCADPRLNHEVEVLHGVEAGPASTLLDAFFATRRA